MKAQNRLVLEQLQLGEQVDSPDAVDLPIKLAVALLKDTEGKIDIELPVAGNLKDPQFSVAPIVWQTLRNLVLRAARRSSSSPGWCPVAATRTSAMSLRRRQQRAVRRRARHPGHPCRRARSARRCAWKSKA